MEQNVVSNNAPNDDQQWKKYFGKFKHLLQCNVI